MARKSQTVTIAADNRDRGKVFVLTEMSAVAAERWATRALLALSRSGVEMPDSIADGGMAGMAVVGFKALTALAFEDADLLLAEMMACVQIMPDPSRPSVVRNLLIEDDVEEVSTLLTLRDRTRNWTLCTCMGCAINIPTGESLANSHHQQRWHQSSAFHHH